MSVWRSSKVNLLLLMLLVEGGYALSLSFPFGLGNVLLGNFVEFYKVFKHDMGKCYDCQTMTNLTKLNTIKYKHTKKKTKYKKIQKKSSAKTDCKIKLFLHEVTTQLRPLCLTSTPFAVLSFPVSFQRRYGKGEYQVPWQLHCNIPAQENLTICSWAKRR